jgi:hypothetical protein
MTSDVPKLSREEIMRLYGALRSELNELSVQQIRNTAAAAGINITEVPSQSERRSGLGSRAEVMPAIDALFGALSGPAQVTALHVLAERLIAHGRASGVQEIIGKHGFQFIAGSFVPVGQLDLREAQYLPMSSSPDIAKATKRLIDGDLTGAITSACGAVDAETQRIYQEHPELGPRPTSFSAKINSILQRLGVYNSMHTELEAVGMAADDVTEFVNNLGEATNHAAQALQVLRRAMGDVHGSKPALQQSAYDAIKWASAICAIFRRPELGS